MRRGRERERERARAPAQMAAPQSSPTATPRIVYLFGKPGSGKTHVGRCLSQPPFSFEFYDADQWLPEDMVRVLQDGQAFTPSMRDTFYSIVIDNIAKIRQERPYANLAVAQATYKNRHRVRVLEAFPEAEMWLVSAPDRVRVQRVAKRSGAGNSLVGVSTDGSQEDASRRGDGSEGSLAEGSRAADVDWIMKHSSGFEPPRRRHPYKVIENDCDDNESTLQERIRTLLGSSSLGSEAGALADANSHEHHMMAALKEAQHALEIGEVPVACVIVDPQGKHLSYGANRTNLTCDATRHAEFVAVDKLLAQGYSDFSKCTLYVTVEPCIMCAAALAAINIGAVFYGASNEKFGGNGSIMRLHESGAPVPSYARPYPSRGGILKNEAISILRRFYELGNPHAPKPQRPVIEREQ